MTTLEFKDLENEDRDQRARQAFAAIEAPETAAERPSSPTGASDGLTRRIEADQRCDAGSAADAEVDDALDQKAGRRRHGRQRHCSDPSRTDSQQPLRCGQNC